jgi:glutamine amidotransferase
MLVVIDYGGGNLGSLVAALRRRGAAFALSGDPQTLEHAGAAMLPGDGAFAATMRALQQRGLDRAIIRHVQAGKPFLGICVGMQILFEASDEFADTAGLGILPGRVSRFTHAPRVPHMGWNQLEVCGAHPFVENVGSQPYAYFLHSYRAPVSAQTVAACTHGERFSAIVAHDNVMGTQFHPEKSQRTGAALIDNFLRICGEDTACL